MNDLSSFLASLLTPGVVVTAIIALVMAGLAAIAWRKLRAERQRHAESQRLADKLDESTSAIRQGIGLPLQDVLEDLSYVEGKTDDIVAVVTAFQRLYAANRDFTVTPELLFELKDLTSAIDSAELIVSLPKRVRQSLGQVSALLDRAEAEFGDERRSEALRVVSRAASSAEEPNRGDSLRVGNEVFRKRVS